MENQSNLGGDKMRGKEEDQTSKITITAQQNRFHVDASDAPTSKEVSMMCLSSSSKTAVLKTH